MSWAYVTGYFDGEGCVAVRPGGYAWLFWTNKDLASLEAMREFIGAGVIQHVVRPKRGWADCYVLRVYDAPNVRRIIRAMLRYSIVKKAALKKALEQNLVVGTRPRGRIGPRMRFRKVA